MSDPVRLVTAREKEENLCVELLEEILADAKKGIVRKVVIGCITDDSLTVSWAGRPSELLSVAARMVHTLNTRIDENG